MFVVSHVPFLSWSNSGCREVSPLIGNLFAWAHVRRFMLFCFRIIFGLITCIQGIELDVGLTLKCLYWVL